MPRGLPPCFRRKQLGRHTRFASRAAAGRMSRSTLAHMPYIRTYPFPLSTRLLFVLLHTYLVYERENTARHSNVANIVKNPIQKINRWAFFFLVILYDCFTEASGYLSGPISEQILSKSRWGLFGGKNVPPRFYHS